MARYIDANKLSRDVISSWDRDTHKTIEASRIHRQEHHHLMSIIEKQPIADVVEVKHGKWVKNGKTHTCSCCGYFYINVDMEDDNYCPNCGADMRGDE